MNNETQEVKLTPNIELLTAQRNSFQKQLIDNILDYRRHLKIMHIEPNYQRQNTQTGKFTTIDELVNSYRKASLNAKDYVEIIDELLKADKEGKLSEAWSNLEAIPVNIKKEGSEGEGQEEVKV